MQIQRAKVYKILLIILMVLVGTVLYLLLQGNFSHWMKPEKSSSHIEMAQSQQSDQHLKIIERNYKNFSNQALAKQDYILQKTQSLSVSKAELAKKKKITDAMETNLDKHIINEISNLQSASQPLVQADELKQQIRKLHTLSAADKAQFIQEIQTAQQTMED